MRLHCGQCGTRLNLEQVTRNFFFHPEKHGECVRRALLTVILIITAGLVFALWPDQVELPGTTADEVGQARGKLIVLQKGAATEPIVFSEKEVNILFNYLLREGRRKSPSRTELAAVSAAGVAIEPEKLTVRLNYQYGPFAFGPVPLGPFVISYTVAGVLEREPEGLRFAARAGAIGHLPLPALGRKLAADRLARLFQPFKNARLFLSGLEITEMKKGCIAVAVARGPR